MFNRDELGVVAAKIRTLAAMVRALAAAAPSTSEQSLLAATLLLAAALACSNAFACSSACLQQRLQQQLQQQQQHLHDQHRVRRHAPDLRRYDALFTVEPLSFLWSYR